MADPDLVSFLLDGQLHQVQSVAPTRTVLQFLRDDLARTGTKEGCAEGDCGACTVVLAERLVDDGGERLQVRAVNSCIQFVPTLDGKALFTVESLKRGGNLHPVQQAMADGHGSQCGFCTPGFVMSMFALYKNESAPSRTAINDALAGNLCRCTGYRPIVDAACAMYELAGPAQERLPDPARAPLAGRDAIDAWQLAPAGGAGAPARAGERALLDALAAIERKRGASFASTHGTFHAPRTLEEFAALRLAHPRARVVAGSTDVGLWVTKQHRDLGDVIYTGAVAGLRTVRRGDARIDIGAAVSVTDAMPLLAAEYPDFDELFRRYGSPPIRNAATLGGNIANGSPIGDSMPGLIALGTRITLRRGTATRQMPLEDFYVGYQKNALVEGEFVERVSVPRALPGLVFKTYKVSKRFDQDISALCAAFAATIEGGTVKSIRIAFGGMAATPRRALAAERAIAGKPWTEATLAAGVAALARDYAPISDMRASDDYRSTVAGNLLRRFFLETTAGADAAPLRLYDFALASSAATAR